MRVPLTIADQIERAELIYPDRVGIVDEPDGATPGACQESLGTLTYRRIAELARAQAAALDERGIGEGRAGRRRQPEQRPPVHQLLRRERVRSCARCRSTSASTTTRSRTSSTTAARRCCCTTPSSKTPSTASSASTSCDSARRRTGALPRGPRAAAVGEPDRGRHRHHQLHERDHGTAEGRAADASQPVGQLDHVRLAHDRVRPRLVPPHVADVPLQRLGDAVRAHGHGREAGRAAQGRRQRHPPPHRRARA